MNKQLIQVKEKGLEMSYKGKIRCNKNFYKKAFLQSQVLIYFVSMITRLKRVIFVFDLLKENAYC